MIATAQKPKDSGTAAERAPLMRSYLAYVGYFVGAGMISGGVVHHPLDSRFYSLLIVAGVVLFLGATVLNEVILSPEPSSPSRIARLIGASLLLSFGIGMFSGGIQHFTDFPDRAAVLIPLGVVVSFGAYILRFAGGHPPRRLVAMACIVVAIAAGSFFGLQALAGAVGEGSHSHGSEHSASALSV